jgi:folate-binding protein YgfZ
MLTYALLENRGILRIAGADRFDFLQGLVSNDIHKLAHQKAIYTLLLSPQGKFQYDMFAISVGDEIWLETSRSRLEELKKRLTLFKLKSSVTLELDLSRPIFTCWGNTNALVERMHVGPENDVYSPTLVIFQDPRLPELGMRIIPAAGIHLSMPEGSILVDEATYVHKCLQLGVPVEADMPIDKAIPLECGMDELNAIDWNKGCYMGQELTARTRYRGLVRKRLIPCFYEGSLTDVVVTKNDREVGEIRSYNSQIVMVLLRLEALEGEGVIQCGSAVLTPHIPHWMHLPEGES